MFSGKFIKGNLSVVSDNINTHNLKEALTWE